MATSTEIFNLNNFNDNIEINPLYDIPIYNRHIHNNSTNKIKKRKLILSGGGIKGIALLGSLKYLEEQKILENIDTYLGTSVGAIILSLINIGYSISELYKFVLKFDFTQMHSFQYHKLINSLGINNHDRVDLVLNHLFSNKKIDTNITFKELYELTSKKLMLTTTCINDNKQYILSHETHPNLSVILGIKMSMSIPIMFSPISYNNNLYIDGGCANTFPINIFKHNLDETIGLILFDYSDKHVDITNINKYLLELLKCIYNSSINIIYEEYKDYSVLIDIKDVSPFDFNVSTKTKNDMFESGYEITKKDHDKLFN